MAQLVLDPLKYLNQLPNFDGNIDDLQNFCDLIDRIHPFLMTFNVGAQPIFVDTIKSKLKGHAKLVMDINCQVVSWPEIKTVLLNNFGDKKTCEELYDDLRNVSFQTNCVDFYNALTEKLRRLNNKTLIVTGAGNELNECTRNNKRSALNFFMSKIPEPMKSILVCRDPESLEEAMEILFKAGYAYHGKDFIRVKQDKNIGQRINTNKNSDNGFNNNNRNNNNHGQFRNSHNNSNYNSNNNYNNSNSNNNYNNNNSKNNYNNNSRENKNNPFRNYNASSNQNIQNSNYNNFNNQSMRNNGNNFHRRENQVDQNVRNNPQYRQMNQRQYIQPPEPMEIEHHEAHAQPKIQPENFRLVASKKIYHI